jgi:hypothetical protein
MVKVTGFMVPRRQASSQDNCLNIVQLRIHGEGAWKYSVLQTTEHYPMNCTFECATKQCITVSHNMEP